MIVGAAIMDLFKAAFGPSCLDDLHVLSTAVRKSCISKFLLRFLVEYLSNSYFFPYVSMRHIIRLAPTRERREFLNRFYGYF